MRAHLLQKRNIGPSFPVKLRINGSYAEVHQLRATRLENLDRSQNSVHTIRATRRQCKVSMLPIGSFERISLKSYQLIDQTKISTTEVESGIFDGSQLRMLYKDKAFGGCLS